MSFENYDALCLTVERWLARLDLANDIKDWIWMAECEIQTEVRFQMRDATVTGTATENQNYIELPDDFLEGLYLEWDGTVVPVVNVVSYDVRDTLTRQAITSPRGFPQRGALVHGNKLLIGGDSGSDNAYTLYYKAGVQHLGRDVASNKILQEYPQCLLYGTLKHSAPFLGADERIQTWVTEFDKQLHSVRQAEWRARSGHGALHMRPDVIVG